MGGDVGKFSSKELLLSSHWQQKLGKALSTAGGKQLRDAVAQASQNSTLANAGDGKRFEMIYFLSSHIVVLSSGYQSCTKSLSITFNSCLFTTMECCKSGTMHWWPW